MHSPFLGIDPFIESFGLWEDFHSKLIGEMERSLSSLVPDRYVVRTGERAYVAIGDSGGDEGHEFLPDVVLASARGPEAGGASAPATPDAGEPEAAPVLMQALFQAEYREVFLEIHQTNPERRLVTGIELLSPSNKRRGTKGWRLYHRKRQVYLRGLAHFVELDLLRTGRRMPMAGRWPGSPNYLLVCRKQEAPRCTVWPAHFRRPLPPLTIPLAAPDPDITLALQPLVEAVYARSHYDRDIDYRRPPRPPLGPSDAARLEERLLEEREPT
jgi:Protein of unknown function (DUF4058)